MTGGGAAGMRTEENNPFWLKFTGDHPTVGLDFVKANSARAIP